MVFFSNQIMLMLAKMRSKTSAFAMLPVFCVAPLIFSLVMASPRTRDECCALALRNGVGLANSTFSSGEPRCGQTYSPDLQPAPDILVPISWWCDKCEESYAPDGNRGNFWIQIFSAYTLPIVALALAFSPQKSPFPLRTGLIKRGTMFRESITDDGIRAGIEILTALIVIPIDSVLCFLSAMLMCGPIVLSCLHEILLNYGALRYLRDRHRRGQPPGTGSMEEIELIIAIFSGDLKATGLAFDIQKDIEAKLRARPEVASDEIRIPLTTSSKARPSSLFTKIVATVISIEFLLDVFNGIPNEGGNACRLTSSAFGIWLLGTGIMVAISEHLTSTDGLSLPERSRSRAGMDIRAPCGPSSPNPVDQATEDKNSWICEGSVLKMYRLHTTAAWEDLDFRKQLIAVNNWWPLICVTASLLTIIPSALAVFIEWTIREPRDESISRVIISYTCVQCFLVCFWARSQDWVSLLTREGLSYEDLVPLWERTRFFDKYRKGKIDRFSMAPWERARQINSNLDGALLLRLAQMRRIQYGVFTTAHIILLILVGVYVKPSVSSLCRRDAECHPIWQLFHACYSTIALASDTQQERNAGRQQILAVSATFGFLGYVTWIGWWQQRHLRWKIAELVGSPGQQRAYRTCLTHKTLWHFLSTYMGTASNPYHRLKNKLVRPRLKSGFRRLEWCCVSRLLVPASLENR